MDTSSLLLVNALVRYEERRELLNALERIVRPLLANLLREPSNPKFQRVRKGNAQIAKAIAIGPVSQLLSVAGFKESFLEPEQKPPVAAAAPIPSSSSSSNETAGTPSTEEAFLCFEGSSTTLMDAERILTALEDRLTQEREEEAKESFRMPLKDSKALRRAEKEQEEARLAVLRKLEQDRLEQGEAAKAKQREEELRPLIEKDFEEAKELVETAKKTMHYHGRLRNASFAAEHFSLRRMRHGRALECRDCDPNHLEAHWHVRNAAMTYSYVVHLSPDAKAVIHTGPEYGYQYNSLPGTPNFGKTVHISTKVVLPNGTVDCQTPNVPATECRYCLVPFLKLSV